MFLCTKNIIFVQLSVLIQVNDYDGVITASLMIPVTVKQSTSYPLSIEDTNIPFIEDESRQNNSKYLPVCI